MKASSRVKIDPEEREEHSERLNRRQGKGFYLGKVFLSTGAKDWVT